MRCVSRENLSWLGKLTGTCTFTRRRISRPTWISLLVVPPVLPFLLPFALTRADSVNVTLDDASSSIVYSPASAWHESSVPCSTCLAPSPSIAFQGTWHDGTHIIPTEDTDDSPNNANNVVQPTPTPSNAPGGDGDVGDGKKGDTDDGKDGDDVDAKDKDGGGDSDKGKGKKGADDGKRRRRHDSAGSHLLRRQNAANDASSNPFFTPNFDSDDAGFVDNPVSAQLNFTGSAIYVYALIPLGLAQGNSTPTFMNLTFLLDSHPAGTYQHTGTASASGFLPSQPIFGQTGLAEAPHNLTIQIGPDSVLLLDYIVYTKEELGDGTDTTSAAAFSTSSSAPGVQETGSGAVGGSVGLLAVLALSLAISIYRRRVRARRRDRRLRRARNHSDPNFDGESFHTDASEDSPPMQGPTPFIPRYFPGTVIPTRPPPYSPSADVTTALLSSTTPAWSPVQSPSPGEDRSYADRPPPTPPPLSDEDVDDFFAPPSFAAAISSPIPAILAGYSPVPTSVPVSTSPVPRHTNGSGSRGVYATDPPPTRSRASSDAGSLHSGYSDRPPSFASQAPPLIPLPAQNDGDAEEITVGEETRQRISDGDRASVRSTRSQ
ncbi:hypothetical protein BD310DRAFT_831897 [Dichomitus squalens]|uniref:Uncharacterized protein n=1 Tax=Dichomitus squalens TaxID=114155 RepID=A0A4Q9PCN9_9APHY|nr:hypothetical protein BD310DRAFT_831897 [Dichomitus squalens]